MLEFDWVLLDPLSCDVIVTRGEQFTGKQAVLAGSGLGREPEPPVLTPPEPS